LTLGHQEYQTRQGIARVTEGGNFLLSLSLDTRRRGLNPDRHPLRCAATSTAAWAGQLQEAARRPPGAGASINLNGYPNVRYEARHIWN